VLPRERRNLLLSIFSFSYVSFMVVPVFVFYLGDSGYSREGSPSPIPLVPDDIKWGMLVTFVAFAMLLVGYTLPLGRLLARGMPRMRREWSTETALGVALLMLPLGWAVVMAGQFGLIPARAGSGVLGAIAQGATYGIGLIAICYQRYRSRVALLLLGLTIPPTMFFNFFTGSKGLFLRPLVLIAIIHIIATRRLRVWWILGFLALMSALYPMLKTYREFMYANHLTAVQVIAKPRWALNLIASYADADLGEYLEAGIRTTASRLNGLGILSVVVRDTPGRVPFQNGRTLAFIPLSYVPRALWPGKPEFTTGYWVTSNYGFGPHISSSTGCTWMGELYFNFGWSGVIVGMALLGVWFRLLQESYLGVDATIPAMLAGVITILTLATGVGGDMLGATNTVIFNIAPLVLVHMLLRVVVPPPARPPPLR
jgi:hypothetical protein